jgi:hypothetical protein
MKVLLFTAAFAVSAMADVVCQSAVTYQDLINDGSCSIVISPTESLQFSGFTFTMGGIGSVTPNQVGVTTLDGAAGTNGEPVYGFQFDPGLGVSGTNQSEDILLNYSIVSLGTGIVSDDLAENAAATGSGVAEVSETFTGLSPLLVTQSAETDDVPLSVSETNVQVSKDIEAFTGSAGGTAAVSGVTDAVGISPVSAVPEPSMFFSVGVGIVVLAALIAEKARRDKAS